MQQIVGKCNRIINESSPIVDARLENGSRVNVVVEPACIGGPGADHTPVPRFSYHHGASDCHGKYHTGGGRIFGGTGKKRIFHSHRRRARSAGKTTFLNALSHYIPGDERIITIEDTAELQIQGIENLVRLEARSANMEGGRQITIRELIKTALRMRPQPDYRGRSPSGGSHRPAAGLEYRP